jgi:hypothetical protein
MSKEIILYNLAPGVTDEEYAKYVAEEKGPFLEGLSGVEKFHLIKITSSQKGEIPYRYVGIVELTSMEEWEKSTKTKEFGRFIEKWVKKVSDFHILFGEEIY